MANPQTVEVKVDASKLLGSVDDLSEEFLDRLADKLTDRIIDRVFVRMQKRAREIGQWPPR